MALVRVCKVCVAIMADRALVSKEDFDWISEQFEGRMLFGENLWDVIGMLGVILLTSFGFGYMCAIKVVEARAKAMMKANKGTQTDEEHFTGDIVFVTESGQRWHASDDCHGLRNANSTMKLERCWYCREDIPSEIKSRYHRAVPRARTTGS